MQVRRTTLWVQEGLGAKALTTQAEQRYAVRSWCIIRERSLSFGQRCIPPIQCAASCSALDASNAEVAVSECDNQTDFGDLGARFVFLFGELYST